MTGDMQLLLDGVHTVQIGKQQTTPLATADDYAVLLGIQLGRGVHRLRLP